ncbi:MAG: VapC toxin family PIN domain ribonuclease [Gallionellales bacterium 35-53-114]|jgi:toxin-antitoxin system PIN domain toxin|nr:MAG: VapC toxin family PIN domain ribonuclease [Gallionellales bacterium 35-53-114]OYZ64369.1 MAG: VapC toxin family PIN domain ribonuclease [Gallionellales bacterium 24-53-125]OZB10322.1 MAG: VapC toxin family PIN domain ribonuclease [Gallionellales bacterium 39-52-133]HQS56926.1 VapC toxin family PIN domain ribonuclease [Gallionellaceae bacterium]HQS75290.1 VapC toxin family PIN domain ribonuclease [Gallionellaceae bacterium]
MRALLDVNVLIALLDSSHMHNKLVTGWLADNIDSGWASCPITQNGCIRIFSQPGYPNTVPAAQVANRLAEAAQHPLHEFWPDSVSLLHPDTLIWDRVLSSRQVTDVYLLALAIKQGGRFVTLDQGIPLDAVADALPKHLVTLA